MRVGILERLAAGEVILGDGSYVFTLEKRGYVKVGKFTPEAACEHPEAVRQLATEFARAGADVTQTFTYGTTEGMLAECKFTPLEINQSACDIAWSVASPWGSLVAGGISQTKAYTYGQDRDKAEVQREVRHNADILLKNKVDFIILEYFRNCEEMEWALECLADCGVPLLATMCIGPRGDPQGVSPGECAVRMAQAGAVAVGANCLFDPFINLEVMKMMKVSLDAANLKPYLMCQGSEPQTEEGMATVTSQSIPMPWSLAP